MIADKIERIGIQYRLLIELNQIDRFKRGIKNNKSQVIKDHRAEEIKALEDMCIEEGVSFKAVKNILNV